MKKEMREFLFNKIKKDKLSLLTNYSDATIIQINEILNKMFHEEKFEYILKNNNC